MKTQSMTKKELALMAGVSRNTFGRWLRMIEPQLIPLGYHRSQRLLQPALVAHIIDHFCI